MKKLLATTAAMITLIGPAVAQNSTGFLNAPAEGDIYASNLMGMNLYVTEKDVSDNMVVTQDQRSTEWTDIGEISDVLLSQDGQVRAVANSRAHPNATTEQSSPSVEPVTPRRFRDGEEATVSRHPPERGPVTRSWTGERLV